MTEPLFVAAFPYQQDILALPVTDLDQASAFYCEAFGMTEVERHEAPPAVILKRDGVRIGFAVTGGDPSQDGAAIQVRDLEQADRNSPSMASMSANRGLTNGTARSCAYSSSSLPTVCASTSISRWTERSPIVRHCGVLRNAQCCTQKHRCSERHLAK